MIFIHDTRDQVGKHDKFESWMVENGHELIRQKMDVGDVMLLGDGSICIDLKTLGLSEVYSNLVHSHTRFRNECIRAQEQGIRLIILVEEKRIRSLEDVKTWKNPQFKRWERKHAEDEWLVAHGMKTEKEMTKPPVSSKRLAGMMDAMSISYGVEWMFCHPDDVGETVYNLLAK